MSSFWTFVKTDWIFAIPMIVMSFTGITLIIWRILLNRGSLAEAGRMLARLKETLPRDGIKTSLAACQAKDDQVSQTLFQAGVRGLAQGALGARKDLFHAMEFEILPSLNFLLPTMLAIAKIATMVGLLGTVISMIGTFNKIQEAKGGVSEQAGSIGLALYATALGLITAIPLVFAHVLFKAHIANMELRLKQVIQRFLDLVSGFKSPVKN